MTANTRQVAGVAVTAANSDAVATVELGGGAGALVAATISGGLVVLVATTTASIATLAQVNAVAWPTTTANPAQSVVVSADNDEFRLGVSFGGSGAGIAATVGASLTLAVLTTTASIDTLATVHAQQNVLVIADADEKIITVTAGIAIGGLVGVGGGAALLVVKSDTHASIGIGAAVQAQGNVLVSADDDTFALTIIGTAAGGVVGIGVSASLSVILKTTHAWIAASAEVDGLGNDVPGIGGVLNPAGGSPLSGFHGVAVQADSSENINTVVIAGAFAPGIAGIAGGVALALIKSTTDAWVAGLAKVNQKTGIGAVGTSQTVNVVARNDAHAFSFSGALGVGGVGIGGAIDVGIMINATTAHIDALALTKAAQDINVSALASKSIQSVPVSAGGGLLAVALSLSLWSVGAPLLPSFKADENGISATTNTGAPSGATSTLPAGTLNDTVSGGTNAANGVTDLANGTDVIAILDGSANITGLLNQIQAASALSVITSTVTAAAGQVTTGLGPLSLIIPALTAANLADTTATIAGTAVAGRDINVRADSHIDFVSVLGGISGGFLSVGGSVAILSVGSTTDAGILGTATVDAGGQILVDADFDDTLVGVALGGSGGVAALGASIAITVDASAQRAHIDDSATVTRALGGITVDSGAVRTLVQVGLGASLGAITVTGSLGVALVSGDNTAEIGNVALGGSGAVGGLTVTSHAQFSVSTNAISAGAGAVSLAGAFAWVDLSGTTKASSNANGTVGSGGVTVRATGDQSIVNANTVNVVIGAVAGGLTIAHAEDRRNTEAVLNATPSVGTTLSTTGAVEVSAIATNHALAVSPGGGGGAINVNVMFATALVKGYTKASLSGTITNAAGLTISAHADNDANASIVVIGVSVVGGNGAFADAQITSAAGVEALLLSGSSVTTSGPVKIEAKTINANGVTAAKNRAVANAGSGALGAITIAYMVAKAQVAAPVRAKVDGTIAGTSSSLTITALSDNEASATTVTVGLGVFTGSGSGADAQVTSSAVTEAIASSTSSLRSNGAISISATSTNDAFASSDGGAGGVVAVALNEPRATVAGATTATLAGGVPNASGVTVSANSGNHAKARAIVVKIGIISGTGSKAVADITSAATTNANGGTSGTWMVGAGAVSLTATSANFAESLASSVAFSGIDISLLQAQSTVSAGTHASFGMTLGSSTAKAGSLTVRADARDVAVADGNVFGVSIASIGFAKALATIATAAAVDATLGTNAVIWVTGGVTIEARHVNGAGARHRCNRRQLAVHDGRRQLRQRHRPRRRRRAAHRWRHGVARAGPGPAEGGDAGRRQVGSVRDRQGQRPERRGGAVELRRLRRPAGLLGRHRPGRGPEQCDGPGACELDGRGRDHADGYGHGHMRQRPRHRHLHRGAQLEQGQRGLGRRHRGPHRHQPRAADGGRERGHQGHLRRRRQRVLGRHDHGDLGERREGDVAARRRSASRA